MQSVNFNSYLQNLEDEWAHLMRQRGDQRFPQSFCAYETKATYGKVIVPRKDAATSCDETPIAFDEDHITIVKPLSTQSPIYDWARARIEKASRDNIARQKGIEDPQKRIEFLLESRRPISTATFRVGLNRSYTPDELGHFRILLEVIDLQAGPNHPSLWFGARDGYINWPPPEIKKLFPTAKQPTKIYATQTVVWSRNPDEKLQDTMIGPDTIIGVAPRLSDIVVRWAVYHKGPFQTIESLNNKLLNVFVSESLADKVAYFGFSVDNYLLAGFPINCLGQGKSKPLVEWPSPLSANEKAVGWIGLSPQWRNRPPPGPHLWLNFTEFTPVKLGTVGSWSTIPDCDLSKFWPRS